MECVRVGIVGLGKMGLIRARELERREDALIVAGYDPDPAAFSAQYPNAVIKDSMEDLIRSDLDAVFVCTPNRFTPGIVVAALDAGKHVFCEKPPGRTLTDIENIIAAEKRNPGLKLTFGFNHRYHGGIQEAKRIVDSGRLGKILWLRGIYGKSGSMDFESQWRSKKELVGAGILLDQGIHMIDLFRFFLGDFVEVKSMVSTAYWNIDVEDNAFALLRDAEGRIAMLHSSSTQWKHRFSLEVYLSDGYICVNGILSSTRSYGEESVSVARKQLGNATAQGKPREEILYFDADPSWELEVANFLGHVLNDTPVESGTSEQALKAMRLVYAIYQNDATFMKSKSAPITE